MNIQKEAAAVLKSQADEPRVLREMFAANPTCGECKKTLERIEDAVVSYFPMRSAWGLFHRGDCQWDAIIPRLGRRFG